jgi:hypothetical protein
MRRLSPGHIGQGNSADTVNKQISLAVLTDGMAWIDATGHLEVNRVAPGAADIIGVDDKDRLLAPRTCRNVDKVAPFVLHHVHCPDRANGFG